MRHVVVLVTLLTWTAGLIQSKVITDGNSKRKGEQRKTTSDVDHYQPQTIFETIFDTLKHMEHLTQHNTAEVDNDVTRNTYVAAGGDPIDRSDFIISNHIDGGDSLQVPQERYFIWELGVKSNSNQI